MTRTIESHETALTLINQASFYADAKDLMQVLALNVAKGTYEPVKAVNAFTRLISKHVNGGKEWREVYAPWKPTVADRKLAAVEMLEHYSEELAEMATDMIGPEFVQVKIDSFDHDMYGNPTARHVVASSTNEGGMVKRLSASWDPRRVQVGYGDRTAGVTDALRKAGILEHNYRKLVVDGSRSEGSIVVLFKRKPFKVEGV